MSEAIVPFVRNRKQHARASWTLRLMRLHLAVVGVGLLLAALVFGWYLYTTSLDRVDLGWSLRIRQAGDVYEPEKQAQVLVLLALAVGAAVELRAVNALRHGEQGGGPAYLGALGLLAGLAVAAVLWQIEVDIPGLAPATAQKILRVVAVLLAAQSLLALWYLAWLRRHRVGRTLAGQEVAGRSLRRVIVLGLALWLLLIGGLAVGLAVLTRWIDLPVDTPQPGQLLYATSFEDFTDEWDLYGGTNAAQIVPDATEDGAADQVLEITYGAAYTNESVFSALDRTFGDFDLRATARVVSGPADNQYGVIFRYRDLDNYYGFMISGDGYYSLVKVRDGLLEFVSDWGQSEVIRQGTAPNEIRIVARGDAFQFFVNGELMPLCLKGENANSMWYEGECFTDTPTMVYHDTTFAQGQIALAAGHSVDVSEPVAVAFDDVVIVGPQRDLIAPDATAQVEELGE